MWESRCLYFCAEGPAGVDFSRWNVGTAVYLLPAVLEGFLVVMVVCGNAGCQEQAPTATANYLACSLLLALYKRYPGAREWDKASQKKVGDWVILAAWLSAGWYPKRSVGGWEFILVPACVLQTKLLWFICHLSLMLPAHPLVGLVGWVGMLSWVAPHHPTEGLIACQKEDSVGIRISWGVLVSFSVLNGMVPASSSLQSVQNFVLTQCLPWKDLQGFCRHLSPSPTNVVRQEGAWPCFCKWVLCAQQLAGSCMQTRQELFVDRLLFPGFFMQDLLLQQSLLAGPLTPVVLLWAEAAGCLC